MSLPGIRFLHDEANRTNFDFSHWNSHLAVVQALKSQMGVTVQLPPLHPVPEDRAGWELLHQSLHDSTNKALQTAGRDLTTDVFKPEWVNSNYFEHAAWAQVLGV